MQQLISIHSQMDYPCLCSVHLIHWAIEAYLPTPGEIYQVDISRSDGSRGNIGESLYDTGVAYQRTLWAKGRQASEASQRFCIKVLQQKNQKPFRALVLPSLTLVTDRSRSHTNTQCACAVRLVKTMAHNSSIAVHSTSTSVSSGDRSGDRSGSGKTHTQYDHGVRVVKVMAPEFLGLWIAFREGIGDFEPHRSSSRRKFTFRDRDMAMGCQIVLFLGPLAGNLGCCANLEDPPDV